MNSQSKLLIKVVLAILSGIIFGFFMPIPIIRVFSTFNALFGNFLGFFVPILVFGLIAGGIANMGSQAGRLLIATVLLAYGFTLFSGFFTYGVCELIYPKILTAHSGLDESQAQTMELYVPWFTLAIKPFIEVTSALVLAFLIGLGITACRAKTLNRGIQELCDIIFLVVRRFIIPCLPLYIFGIFLIMTASGQVTHVLNVFLKLIVIIFGITVVMLGIQFGLAGLLNRRNPFRLLWNMIPAYLTALGTQSSAATIPVTLEQTIKNGVDRSLAKFVIPLCATIHLSGSTMKITACSLAIILLSGMDIPVQLFSGFILMLGITMVAAPGVPGGAIMASVGILQSILGFSETQIGLMIALYIAMDSFGTACNVTGDGAIALILNRFTKKSEESTDSPIAEEEIINEMAS